jgi:hypothetical protein
MHDSPGIVQRQDVERSQYWAGETEAGSQVDEVCSMLPPFFFVLI